jgi:membrane associated rhomboid family serine protease
MQEGYTKFHQSVFVTAGLIVLLFAVHALKITNVLDTSEWGIYPREAWGAGGILLAPLVHGSLKHLLSNAAPLIVTMLTVYYFYHKVFFRALLMIWFFTGLLVWLLAERAWHIGASGVVYGLVSFIFWTGVFRKNKRSIFLAMIMLILYSGMIQGIAPTERGISWESHFYGSIMGILAAWWFKNEIEEDEADLPIVFEKTEKNYFLARDVFEKTKMQLFAEEQERLQQLALEEQERMRQSMLNQGFPPFYYTVKKDENGG